jgi:hypothetical protein
MPGTTYAERQVIVRQVLDRVIVTVLDDTEKVNVELQWVGGHCTRTQIIRPVARLEQLSYYRELLARVAALSTEGLGHEAIAETLNAEGWRPAKRRPTFNAAMVAVLLARQGLRRGSKRQHYGQRIERKADEWTLSELALELGVPSITLYAWLGQGRLRARQAQHGTRRLWLVWADKAELHRLQELRRAPRRWSKHLRVDEVPPQSHA